MLLDNMYYGILLGEFLAEEISYADVMEYLSGPSHVQGYGEQGYGNDFDRYNSIILFQNTLGICNHRFYFKGTDKQISMKLNKEDMEAAWLFPSTGQRKTAAPNDAPKKDEETGSSNAVLLNCDSFEAARCIAADRRRVLVLNFANPVTPGGGVTCGARAQEEDLCRKSSLYLSLNTDAAKMMYNYNKRLKDPLASDYMLLSPYVEIIRDANGELLDETHVVSVLTAAAPMINHGSFTASAEEIEGMLRYRIRKMLHVAFASGYMYLVLGAWGCGAFGNDARVVARLFSEELISFENGTDLQFKKVAFAVLDKSENQYNYKCFREYFSEESDMNERIRLMNEGIRLMGAYEKMDCQVRIDEV